jgi:hypothetical protein
MKKSEYAVVIFIVSMAVMTLFQFSFVQIASAQELNPCPPGEFPETDSNGDFIHDSLTGQPICNPVP